MKQTRQQKLVWVEIKQKDSGMQKYRKQTAAGIMKRRGRKEYVWQNEYIKHVYERPNCQCVYKIHYEIYNCNYLDTNKQSMKTK